jgi:2-polyprenyl-6-methoxyphenol hydroxylase-like FAD-dependent oxidoreductase
MFSAAGKQAVVVGAGMAGLTAARSLADFFEHVVVLDNDTLPEQAAPRSGTPQSRHVHALLPGGQRALGRLFPGFEESLSQSGAVRLSMGYDYRVERPGYDPFPQRDLGIPIYSMTRPLLEFTVRKRLAEYRNVEIRKNCKALEFIATPGDTGETVVTGIRCEDAGGRNETLPAGLAIDASAHGNLTLALLNDRDFPLPKESSIGIDIGYATALFDIPEGDFPNWRGAYTFPDYPRNDRSALILPVEGRRWMLTLAGRYDQKPPADWDEFLLFAQQLRTPTVYNLIRRAKRPEGIVLFGLKASRWRHFERLEKFPRRLLPLGDSICRFNPIYGQGMTVAALEAEALGRLLKEQSADGDRLARLPRAFFVEAEKLIDTPWWTSAIPDFLHPRTEGERPKDIEDSLEFSAALMKLAARDAAIHKLVIEVQSLIKFRSEYKNPELVERVRAVMAEPQNSQGQGPQ